MINRVILVGRLGRDPEMRYTGSGTPVVNFSLATNERWSDQNGGRQERTEWHNIVVWSKLAEICNQYLSKGQLVYIEGRLQTREWDDRDGNRRRTTEIVAREMKMLGPRSDEMGMGPTGERPGSRPTEPSQPSPEVEITDDDIPF
jgi:single-strand DNA-binding protein